MPQIMPTADSTPKPRRPHSRTGMLKPKKSLLAIFGITRQLEKVRRLTDLVPCHNCSLAGCKYRRVPYAHFLPNIGSVSRIPSSGNNDVNEKTSPLDSNAKYSINPRALEKWSKERLQLSIFDDRSIEARFRYEGTTCSNMGRTLEFDYRIKLGVREEGYKILDAVCAPAPGDIGHTLMCQYLENTESFIKTVRNEKPFVGKSLNDVLHWKRQYNPSACYCSEISREYKWGLVYEVLHYTLVQKEKMLVV